MSRNRCCVPGCHNEDNLHLFPNPKTRYNMYWTWLMKIRGEILYNGHSDMYIYYNRKVCSKHFEPQFIYANRLNPLAVPTLHLKAPITSESASSSSSTLRAVDSSEEMQTEEKQLYMPVIVKKESGSKAEFNVAQCDSISNMYADHSYCRSPRHEESLQCDATNVSMVVNDEEPATKHISEKKIELTSSIGSKTRSALNSNEHKFCKEITKAKKRIQYLTKKYDNFKIRFREAKKLQKTLAFHQMTHKLSWAAKTIVEAIVTQSHKKSKGRRFTIQQKVLCLTLYKTSSRMYRLLSAICGLPKRKTLNMLLSLVDVAPGKNERICSELKRKIRSMPQHHKYISLLFDEMKIAPGLTYNKKKDKIDGFIDDGTQKCPKLADHALVFMLRGVIKKYKQPFLYSFCRGTTKTGSLIKQIKDTVNLLQQIGFVVLATVCDQGQTSQAVINNLLQDTRAEYLRRKEEIRGSFFEVNQQKIVPIFDPPHLLKGVRNNLITKDLKYEEGGLIKVAKWKDLLMLYKRSPKYSGVRLVPKITARHIIPKKIPKMKVKYATQVFSRSVGVAMGYLSKAGHLPESCQETADVLLLFDKLFDSVNGGSSKIKNGKIYRSALTPRSAHHSLWRRSMSILKSMRFISGQKLCLVPSIKNWLQTIESFRFIALELRQKLITSILPRNFNQDPLENFFGAVRAQGYQNVMPNVCQFETAFKTLSVNKYALKNPDGANCENEDSPFLQSLQYFLSNSQTTTPNIPNNEIQEVHEKHLYFQFKSVDELIKSQSLADKEKCSAVGYCSGWVLKVLKQKLKCEECNRNLNSNEQKDYHEFIMCSEYSEKVWLTYPTKEFIECFYQIENIVIAVLKDDPTKIFIANYCNLLISIHVDFTFLKCSNHRDDLILAISNKVTTFCLNNWCREVNEIIIGKNLLFDDDDIVKKEALSYYETYNKNKK